VTAVAMPASSGVQSWSPVLSLYLHRWCFCKSSPTPCFPSPHVNMAGSPGMQLACFLCVRPCRAQAARGADVYSFGVMMWELWHGKTAWQQLLDM
jgi:hypothetical protein